MHCTSIQINQFLNSYLSHHLKGIDLQYLTKIFLNLPCQGKQGHNSDASYTMPLSYTAKILGRGVESIRTAQERLHARGIITIDGESWDEYRRKDGGRKKTGMLQEVRFSLEFKKVMRATFNKITPTWIFEVCEGFRHKAQALKAKALEAKERHKKKIQAVVRVLTDPKPSPHRPVRKEITGDVKHRVRRILELGRNEYTKKIQRERAASWLVGGGYCGSKEEARGVVDDLDGC